MQVKVKKIPIRYNKHRYQAGETFEIQQEHVKGIQNLVEIVSEETEEKSLEQMTVAELKEYAKSQDIEIGKTSKKEDILALIYETKRLNE
ncbi:hypothetical protein [Geosporobacter ferrireducens]|uniref:hypothetical protein n=1 Tax=Geosporobacter ferrireducens TaxID=1424294 RepID=UPI00139B3A71|nr:hypothetical protein [Geosporobacter ferrireducens]MTI56151.1 hypothetical protein [Geosporobacter ferrireducens]